MDASGPQESNGNIVPAPARPNYKRGPNPTGVMVIGNQKDIIMPSDDARAKLSDKEKAVLAYVDAAGGVAPEAHFYPIGLSPAERTPIAKELATKGYLYHFGKSEAGMYLSPARKKKIIDKVNYLASSNEPLLSVSVSGRTHHVIRHLAVKLGVREEVIRHEAIEWYWESVAANKNGYLPLAAEIAYDFSRTAPELGSNSQQPHVRQALQTVFEDALSEVEQKPESREVRQTMKIHGLPEEIRRKTGDKEATAAFNAFITTMEAVLERNTRLFPGHV